MTGCYYSRAEQDGVQNQSLLTWGSSVSHCKSMGKDYLKVKMLWSNRSPLLPHRRPNIYCNSQRIHTSWKAPLTNKSHESYCIWAASSCSALLPGSLKAGWFMSAYFLCLCVTANLWITAFYAKNIKCKMRYLKKTPPVATSSHTRQLPTVVQNF